MKAQKTGGYHVTFLSCHPCDNYLCDDNARWWPLWYEYIMDKKKTPNLLSTDLIRTYP